MQSCIIDVICSYIGVAYYLYMRIDVSVTKDSALGLLDVLILVHSTVQHVHIHGISYCGVLLIVNSYCTIFTVNGVLAIAGYKRKLKSSRKQRCDLGLNFVYRVCACIYLIVFVYVSICI